MFWKTTSFSIDNKSNLERHLLNNVILGKHVIDRRMRKGDPRYYFFLFYTFFLYFFSASISPSFISCSWSPKPDESFVVFFILLLIPILSRYCKPCVRVCVKC
uniref:Uncharacterized protein n=1 Tax=Physcomitrium patens TaxID=3218 RepID=A0A2K1K3E5_PHYPA|nr:hypothetical protein PHYPA_012773 [Physcomitrium patens]